MTAPRAFPLAWPASRRRRTPASASRARSPPANRSISIPDAVDRLDAEIERLGGTYSVLSTNIEPTITGRPKGNRAEPSDPGVCVYFQLHSRPYAMACDTFTTVAQNIAAIAEHIKASRAQARYGVATAEETLRAFQALPSPDDGPGGKRHWTKVLGFTAAQRNMNAADIGAQYRALAKENANNETALLELNIARDEALKEIGQ